MPVVIQSATKTSTAGAAITSAALANPTTIGNVIICWVTCYSATTGFTVAVTDSQSATLTQDATVQSPTVSSNITYSIIAKKAVTVAGSSYTCTSTMTGGSGVGQMISIAEVSGISTTLDGAVGTASTGASTGTITATTGSAGTVGDFFAYVFSDDNNGGTGGQLNPLNVDGATTGVVVLQNQNATTIVAGQHGHKILNSAGTHSAQTTYVNIISGTQGMVCAQYTAIDPVGQICI